MHVRVHIVWNQGNLIVESMHHWLMSLVHQAQIPNGGAGLLQGSRSSVVRVSTAKVGGLGSIPSGYPSFFLQYVSILIYHQLLTNSSYYQLL